MCVYFDDVLFGAEDPYQFRLDAGFLSEAEAAAVSEFHALAESYSAPNGDDWNNRAILEDPDWQEIVRAAQMAQNSLLELSKDQAEIESLTYPEHWDVDGGTYRSNRTGSAIVRLSG
jgi:hypothetical protein